MAQVHLSRLSRGVLAPELEATLDRFERAWQRGAPPLLVDYLTAEFVAQATRLKLLKELIKLDLEFRWRSPQHIDRLLLEQYLLHHPELRQAGKLPLDLITEEYRVRQRWGDRPDHQAYLQRFPEHAA